MRPKPLRLIPKQDNSAALFRLRKCRTFHLLAGIRFNCFDSPRAFSATAPTIMAEERKTFPAAPDPAVPARRLAFSRLRIRPRFSPAGSARKRTGFRLVGSRD